MSKALVVSSMLALFLSACGTAKTEDIKGDASTATPTESVTPAKALEAKHKDQLDKIKVSVTKYEDINVAIKDGYIPASGYAPLMGYHFQNTSIQGLSLDKPQILLYVMDGNKYKLVGIEFGVPDPKAKSPFGEDVPMGLVHKASTHYVDGTELEAANDAVSHSENPQTKSKKILWHPNIYGVHAYVVVENPNGAFEASNPALAPYSASPSIAPIDEAHGISKENVTKLTAKK